MHTYVTHMYVLFCYIYIYLFSAAFGSSLLCAAFSIEASRGYSCLRCAGFSLRWLLLSWSMGSRCVGSVVVARGLSSCGTRA